LAEPDRGVRFLVDDVGAASASRVRYARARHAPILIGSCAWLRATFDPPSVAEILHRWGREGRV
jgi:hypothetical protein